MIISWGFLSFAVVASHLGLLAIWLKVDNFTAPEVQSVFEQSEIAVMEITEQCKDHSRVFKPGQQ